MVFTEQKKAVGKGIIVYFKPELANKLGIIVSKKVDKRAVIRNKIKRRIREAFRNNKPELIGSYVVLSKSSVTSLSLGELKQDWINQLLYLKRNYG